MKIGQIHSVSLVSAGSGIQRTQAAIARAMERIASGKRVVSPRDDTAAYSVGVRLDSQIRGFTAAAQNINQTQSLLMTANETVARQFDLLNEMRSIALNASSGTLSDANRDQLNRELRAIVDEFARLTSDAEFNGIKLLDGSFGTKTTLIGPNASSALTYSLPSMDLNKVFRSNEPTGAFNSRTTMSTNYGPSKVTTADINGDGIEDLATLLDLGAVEVRLGLGSGKYGSARTFSIGEQPRDFKLEDMNNDGALDIVAIDLSPFTGTPNVAVRLGNGDGTFETTRTYAAGSQPGTVEIVDIDRDGYKDILVANEDMNSISVYLGSSSGTFSAGTTITSGVGPILSVGDVNRDGITDIVTADLSDSTISIMLGNGSGGFGAATTYAMGVAPVDIKLADFNNDGKLDVATIDAGDGTLSIRLGAGDGTFGSRTTYSTTGASLDPKQLEVGDLNNDGKVDIVVTDGADATVSVYLGNGNGAFAAARTYATGTNASGATIADINGDGVKDIVVADQGADTLSIFNAATTNASAVSALNVSTQAKAQKLLGVLDSAMDYLKNAQGNVSALVNRLDQSRAYGLLMKEKAQSAKDLMINADMALEIADLVKLQIRQNVQVAVLAQANLQLQLVLTLLKK